MSETWTKGSSGANVQDPGVQESGVQARASSVADTAREQASSMASTAGEQAKAVAADARHEARRLVEDGRQQLRDQAGQQTQRAASSLRDLGDQLQRMASGQAPAQGPAVDLAREAADRVQRMAGALEAKRPEELLDDVRRFARQRPGIFVLGALGAGFLAGRLLRAVDTSALTDAAKAGATDDDRTTVVSGPGSLGSLAAGSPSAAPAGVFDPPTATVPTARPEPATAGDRPLGSER